MGFQIVDRISDDTYAEIEAFDNCNLYHTRDWHHFLSRALGWKINAALERDDTGCLMWLLPFVIRRRTSFQPIHVCLPASHNVGFVGQINNAQSLSLTPAEIHAPVEMADASQQQHGFITTLDMTAFPDEDALRKHFHKDSIQRKIDKAEKSGLRVVRANTPAQIEAFERMQIETRWRQGSPTYPHGFFRHMWQSLDEEQFHLHLVYQGDQPVSGILFLHFRDTAIYGYGASVNQRAVWQLGANQLAMWAAIRDAYRGGIRHVDFGSSST